MTPSTTQESSTALRSSQGTSVGLLEQLPETAAAVISQCLDARSRTSLASVSRWARDIVLREARSVGLQVHSTAPRKPVVRLINRVCSAAQAGRLSLNLEAHGFVSNTENNVLTDLLAPAEQQGGWASVKELALKAFPEGSTPVLKLVSTAFPALQRVKLSHMSVARADLGSLSACSQLMRLDLLSCQLQQTGPSHPLSLSPLSTLCSLRQLSVLNTGNTDSSIASGLTQLTGLRFRCVGPRCLGHIIGLTQLQELELGGTPAPITAEEVASILTSCKQLTSLTLGYEMYQPEFDALLTHGPQLTSFTCSSLCIDEDRSASPCSWKELVMTQQVLHAETLPCIPTASLTRLVFETSMGLPSPCPTLEFQSYERSNPGTMPDLVQRGLINLNRCPAWQQCGPGVHVRLSRSGVMSQQLALILGALAPLVNKEVKLSLFMPITDVRASAVQQLSITLGSNLKQLVLEHCRVSEDFWQAVWDHLPGLQQLGVGEFVYGAVGAHQLSVFCGRAARPLQLNLCPELYKKVRAEGKLDQEGRWKGVPQVTVTEAVGI